MQYQCEMNDDDYYAVRFYDNNNYNGLYGLFSHSNGVCTRRRRHFHLLRNFSAISSLRERLLSLIFRSKWVTCSIFSLYIAATLIIKSLAVYVCVIKAIILPLNTCTISIISVRLEMSKTKTAIYCHFIQTNHRSLACTTQNKNTKHRHTHTVMQPAVANLRITQL